MPVINKGGGGKIGELQSINAERWQAGPAIAGWALRSPDSITGVGSWGSSQEPGDLVCSTFHDAVLALSPGSLLVGTVDGGLVCQTVVPTTVPHSTPKNCPTTPPIKQRPFLPPLDSLRPIRVLQIDLSDFPPPGSKLFASADQEARPGTICMI